MKLCRVLFGLVALPLLLSLSLSLAHAASSRPHVDIVTLNNDIDSVTDQYLDRALSTANSDGSSAVLIVLDTPGGDLASMKDMIEHMEASRVPTIVYVYPDGAWAGSAGTFITLAADVAAMAPGTTIGAASPVGSNGSNLPSTEDRKVLNFSISYIAALARDHGHNVAFAEQAVRSAKAIPYNQALSSHVINFTATSIPQLLDKTDGFSVRTPNGTITFHTRGASLNRIGMDWTENIALILLDPNLVLILLSVGTLAIIFELSSPGAILPGIVGVICLAIAFFALGTFPINVAGLILMAFAVLLFIADLKMPTHGFLTVGGIISFALGAVLLFSPSGGGGAPTVSPWAIGLATLLMAGFFGFVVRKAMRAQRWSVKTGTESLVGSRATVHTELNPDGMIYLDGALWKATTEWPPIEKGQEVLVTEIDGLTVRVAPLTLPKSSDLDARLASTLEPLRSGGSSLQADPAQGGEPVHP